MRCSQYFHVSIVVLLFYKLGYVRPPVKVKNVQCGFKIFFGTLLNFSDNFVTFGLALYELVQAINAHKHNLLLYRIGLSNKVIENNLSMLSFKLLISCVSRSSFNFSSSKAWILESRATSVSYRGEE